VTRSAGAALLLFVATVSITIADEVFVVSAAASYPNVWAALNDAVGGASAIVFGGVGLLIVLRRRNAVGWLLCALGLVVSIMVATSSYARTLPPASSAAIAAKIVWQQPWWGIAGSLGWLVAITLLGVFVQVFPDGQPLSPRWRAPLLLTVAWPIAFVAIDVLSPVSTSGGKNVPNPNGLSGLAGDVMLALRAASGPLTLAGAATAVVSAVLRFRRSAGAQRAQVKWFVYAAAVAVLSFTFSAVILPHDVSDLVNSMVVSVVPLSVAVAILRHRLYDIDVVIERTLVYGALSAVLAATYFVSVLAFETVLRPLTEGSEVAVALSTLAVVALFAPLRTRIQAGVDRRFYRSRYDAVRTLETFSVRLHDEIDLEAIAGELLDAVGETMQPAQASLWLRTGR